MLSIKYYIIPYQLYYDGVLTKTTGFNEERHIWEDSIVQCIVTFHFKSV